MGSENKDGGPAFPVPIYRKVVDKDTDDRGYVTSTEVTYEPEAYGGVSVRDYFAAKAMQAVINDQWRTERLADRPYDGDLAPGIAKDAYAIADAMLKAREAQP